MSATASPPVPPKGDSITRGTGWMMLMRLSDRSIGLISTLILARVLTPADFGLVAMAMTVVAMIELMGAFGFDSALIQRQDVDRRHYDTAWTFNIIFSVSAALVLLAMTVPASDFYREPRLLMLLPALAVSSCVQGFENVGTVAFRKELNFQREFRYTLSKKLAAFCVTVPLALIYRSYWALVAGIVVGKLFSVWISYRLHPYRPRFCLAARHDLFHFSKWLFFSNMVLFLQNKADNFILGRTVGSHALGVYNLASELAMMPSTELIAPLNRAAYPFYSKLAADLVAFRRKFQDVFGLIALICIPAAVGLASVSELVVHVLLGPQWGEAVALMKIFTICGLLSALQSNLIMTIIALGKPKAITLLNAATLTFHLPLMIFASMNYGPLGAAYVHMSMSMLALIPLHVVFFRLTGLRLSEHLASIGRPLAAAGGMAGAIWVLRQLIFPLWTLPSPVELIICIVVGASAYLLGALTLWYFAGRNPNSPEMAVMRIVLQVLRARRPRHA